MAKKTNPNRKKRKKKKKEASIMFTKGLNEQKGFQSPLKYHQGSSYSSLDGNLIPEGQVLLQRRRIPRVPIDDTI